MKISALCLSAALAVAAAGPALAGVTVGQNNGVNCYPFSCGPTDGVTDYQQQYNSSAFSGPISFDTISFTKGNYATTGPMDTGSYTVSFYLSATPYGSMTGPLSSNEGTLLGTFGTFSIGGAMPNRLVLNGSMINYDPTQGTLLMDVVTNSGTSFNTNYNVFFSADYTGTDVLRSYDNIGGETLNDTGALQTTFGAAVPEPATWALMLLGVGAAGAMARRRQALVAA